MPPIIALLTDFGLSDAYVGIMKGVILDRCPSCRFIDLTHNIAPQYVAGAAFVLNTAVPYMPKPTVYLVVVDPGVGTRRRALAISSPHGSFVGPDNGFLSYVLARDTGPVDEDGDYALPHGWQAVELTNRRWWREPVSQTFHGRDIFAPCAAALAAGAPLESLGGPVTTVRRLATARPAGHGGRWAGSVLHVDHFGNLITDIDAARLPPRFLATVGPARIVGPASSYEDGAEPGDLLALVGSTGFLEIAVRQGSAAERLHAGLGMAISVENV